MNVNKQEMKRLSFAFHFLCRLSDEEFVSFIEKERNFEEDVLTDIFKDKLYLPIFYNKP
jgi:hypothetical protein